MAALQKFENQQYVCIETYRKNGQGIKTPTWFVQEGELLLIWTELTSGKIKRIRNNSQINITPSRGDGTPLAEWMSAVAQIDDSAEFLKHTHQLLIKKYGFVFHIFGWLGRRRHAQYTTLKIQLND